MERSQQFAATVPIEPTQAPGPRSRRGLSRSRPGQNLEGLTEGELKRQRQHDRADCRKYKKRTRKDLSCDEIEELLNAAKEQHRLHKDLAQQFKIPPVLVGRLVKES